MTATKFNLHAALMKVARAEVKKHIEEYDGETCFNLFTFLEGLESRLYTVMDRKNLRRGNFSLSADSAARYLWWCMAVEAGDAPDGNTFKGMPILD